MDVEAAQNKLVTKQISKNDLQHLMLKQVKLDISLSGVLGQGSYGTVYKAEYNGTTCAAKRLDPSSRPRFLVKRLKQSFRLECLRHSKLHHSNIVKMLGVYYPKGQALPVLVMELMDHNLTQLLENHHNIPMYIKLSILLDVSRGLCYLHAQNPPIVHQALYSDNILITASLQAKIGDFKTGTVSDQAILSIRQNRNSKDFLPNSCFLEYDPPLNVFSFGCVVCHVITQKWPYENLHLLPINHLRHLRMSETTKNASFTEEEDWFVEKHHDYIDLISDNSLKMLVEACLQRNYRNRPHMLQINESITSIMAGTFKYFYAWCYFVFLNQARTGRVPGFLKLLLSVTLVRVCVSPPLRL